MPEDAPADALLMVRLAAGDETALRLLLARWQTPIFSFAYRYLQQHALAADVTQETFVRVYRARERFRREQRFASWIFRIAANLCHNQRRWQRRHPTDPLVDEAGGFHSLPHALWETDSPAAQSERHDLLRLLRREMACLPHAQRTALLLHYYQHLSYREIASVLGCGERGVETRLYRARQSLGARLRLLAAESPPPGGGKGWTPAPSTS